MKKVKLLLIFIITTMFVIVPVNASTNTKIRTEDNYLVPSDISVNSYNKDLILKNQSERGKFKIVENTGGQAVLNIAEENVLAKKSDFAEAIMNDKIQISQESWYNFKHIFEKIEMILNL